MFFRVLSRAAVGPPSSRVPGRPAGARTGTLPTRVPSPQRQPHACPDDPPRSRPEVPPGLPRPRGARHRVGAWQRSDRAASRSSRLCLGANVFGWTADRDTSFAVLDAYTAAGGDFVDTADSYTVAHRGQLRRRVRDDHRRVAGRPGQARRRRDRDQGRLVAPAQGALRGEHRGGVRRLAAPAAHRPHRPLLRAPRRPRHRPGGDARRLRRAGPGGQGAGGRGVQLLRGAAAQRAGDLRARRAERLRRAAAALQPRRARPSSRPPCSRCCRPRACRACPTTGWRRAS